MSFYKSYRKTAKRMFGKVAERNEKSFNSLKPYLAMAKIKILLKDWISLIFFTTLIVYLASLVAVITISIIFGFGLFITIFLSILLPILIAGFGFLLFYIYPVQKEGRIKKNIELNLPFALSHMAALASSGLAPENMFNMMTGFEEYGEISEEAKSIVRNIKVFGMSSVDSLKDVAQNTPSQSFRQILSGMASTIESGGNLSKYLETSSKDSLFDYRVKRETYLKTLSTYADIYTSILVAAPLIFLAVLGIMGIIGGDVFGMSVEGILFLVTWLVLPVLNIGFILFIQMTHPGI